MGAIAGLEPREHPAVALAVEAVWTQGLLVRVQGAVYRAVDVAALRPVLGVGVCLLVFVFVFRLPFFIVGVRAQVGVYFLVLPSLALRVGV